MKFHNCLPPVCPNCPEGANQHKPIAPECPARKFEATVIRMKFDEDISYPEARRRCGNPTFVQAATTFAAATAAPNQPTRETSALEERVKRNKEKIETMRKLIEEEKKQIVVLEALERELLSLRKRRAQLEGNIDVLQGGGQQTPQTDFESIEMLTKLPQSNPDSPSRAPSETSEIMLIDDDTFSVPKPLSAKARRDNFSTPSSSMEKEPPVKAVKKTTGGGIRAGPRSVTNKDLAAALQNRPVVQYKAFDLIDPAHAPKTIILKDTQYQTVVNKLQPTDKDLYKQALKEAQPPPGKNTAQHLLTPAGLHLKWI